MTLEEYLLQLEACEQLSKSLRVKPEQQAVFEAVAKDLRIFIERKLKDHEKR